MCMRMYCCYECTLHVHGVSEGQAYTLKCPPIYIGYQVDTVELSVHCANFYTPQHIHMCGRSEFSHVCCVHSVQLNSV